MTFYTGVKFSKWSDVNENTLTLIRLPCRFKNVCHTYDVNGQWRDERLTPIDATYGLTFDPCFTLFSDTAGVSNYIVSENLINVSLNSLQSVDFENVIPVHKVITFFIFFPLP